MPHAQVRVHVSDDRPGWVVVELLGQFPGDGERPVHESLLEVVAGGAVSLVIDASRLDALGALPCRTLVTAACSLERLRGEVLVTRPPAQLRRMLEAVDGAESIRIVAGGPAVG